MVRHIRYNTHIKLNNEQEENMDEPNPVSPKVYVPTIVLIAILIAQVIVTQEWNSGEWANSAAIVLQALSGYVVTDPQRNVGY